MPRTVREHFSFTDQQRQEDQLKNTEKSAKAQYEIKKEVNPQLQCFSPPERCTQNLSPPAAYTAERCGVDEMQEDGTGHNTLVQAGNSLRIEFMYRKDPLLGGGD